MKLSPGTRLGPYEIVEPLGAGGMGEVFRARDTRLGREVAIKVMPQHVSASPEDRARFKREAKTISSLNHPHICVLHDVGQEGDTDYIVMELVEGETLAQRIARGPLTPAEVLRMGTQIADALERAHRAGIIHRDLKPGNVMLTKSGAKLMDFGLARSAGRLEPGANDVTATAHGGAPKSDEPITAKGKIVGTFQYMAPEQLEGKRVDARADIWALGCVLYEMATGKRAFEGSTPASIISAIMRDQPRVMSELAPLTPPAFEHLVRQCLAKDPEDRWQTAHDVRLQLQWVSEAGSQGGVSAPILARRKSREGVAWALVLAATAGAVTLLFQPKSAPKPIIFELATPPQVGFVDFPRISPDGTVLAFNVTDSANVSRIWVRRMNSLEARRLPGTEGAGRPFWSPDSRNLAFFVAGKRLMKINIGGGPPVKLCDASDGGDGTWSPRGVILFDGTALDSVQMVSAAGGIPTGVVWRDRNQHETGSAWPQFLPDGRHFLYIAYGQASDSGTLKVGSIGSKKTTPLGPSASRVEYASGHLLYVSGSTLIGRPFDPTALKFTGEPVAVAQNVEMNGEEARFSTSSEGTLVFHSGALPAESRLVWINRGGQPLGTVGAAGNYDMPALSPNGTQLAVQVSDSSRSSSELWLWDLSRNLGSRFTFANQIVLHPAWSPDGRRLVYGRKHGMGFDVFVKAASGSGAESLLYASDEIKDVSDWSADGRWILYMAAATSTNVDIYALSIADRARSVPIVTTRFLDVHPALSPDGKWMVYASLESGRWEVYVQSFQGEGGRWRISTQGGIQSFWRGDGREIFYLALDGGLMAVAVEPGGPPRFSLPKRLFNSPGRVRFDTRNQYVPTRDGQRFLFVAPEGEAQVGATTVMLNWPALLPKK